MWGFSSTLLCSNSFLQRIPQAKCPQRSEKRTDGMILCQTADVLIIGGGAAGLSTALELARNGAKVRVLSRDVEEAAAKAAAGMLAPDAEGLEGDNEKLCKISRSMYPRFMECVEELSGKEIGYVSKSDYLLPILDKWTKPPPSPEAQFISAEELRIIEPALSSSVTGAYRVLGDGHVDNRRLIDGLVAACRALHVDICEGVSVQKLRISPDAPRITGVVLESGRIETAGHYVAAAGAWIRSLLPSLPVRPVKGQMLSLEPPQLFVESGQMLQHLLFASNAYIVPKDNGQKFFIGATEEEAGFSRSCTAGGTLKLLCAAIDLVPQFSNYTIAERWAGLRPTTPDYLPIVGESEYDNLTIATGYHRNGILLTPVTAKIVAACAMGQSAHLSADLQDILPSFSYKRFLHKSLDLDNGESVNTFAIGTRSSTVFDVKDFNEKNESSNDLVKAKAIEEAQKRTEALLGSGKVLVWKVLPDGTKIPIKPHERFIENQSRRASSADCLLARF